MWKKRLLSSSLFAGALFAVASPLAAVAQEADDAAVAVTTESTETEARQEKITITGSRFARRDEVAESPILTVTQDTLLESGYTTVDGFLNTLPQITPNLSSQSNNPSSNGRAVLDLRGLGSARNLVLIDGKRGMPSFATGTIDINTIPSALVERVEIITGGAASTYGADAVAGVANFMLRKDFEGIEIDTQYKASIEEGDGVEWGTGITMGSNFADDRGNAVLSLNYFTREVVGKGARDFSVQASSATGTFPDGSYSPGTNTPTAGAVAGIFGPGLCATNGGSSGFGFNPDASLFCTGVAGSPLDIVGYTGPDSAIATAFAPDFFSYNFEPDNFLVLPLNRWNMFSAVDYELNDSARVYGKFTFTNYNAQQELAPTPANGFTVPVSNPFIPAQLSALLATRTGSNITCPATPANIAAGGCFGGPGNGGLAVGGSSPNSAVADNRLFTNPALAPFTFNKRFNSLGGRNGSTTHDVWQFMIGMDGDLAGTDTWTYDVYYSQGRSTLNEVQGGNVRLPRVEQLLDAADGGASLCAGGLNLFGNAPISQACQAYVSLEAKNLTEIEQKVIEGTIQGEIFDLPAGALQTAFGVQYRELDFNFRPDSGLQPGQVAGFNEQLPTSGYLDWYDVYGEALIPVLKDLPLVEELSLTAGYRLTENSRSGSSDTWKLNGDWKVNDYLRFRGGYQKAIRSPGIAELFAPAVNNFPTFTSQDPCNSNGAATLSYGRNGPNGANVAALCAAQSAVAGGALYVQPFGQARGIVGGNPDLKPEESKSWTAGLVMTSPFTGNSFSESLGLTVDYWWIELDQAIGAFAATTIVQRCFNRDGANPTFDPSNSWCQLFNRDQSDGGVINLNQLNNNDSRVEKAGVDITARWGFDLADVGMDVGSLNWNAVATYIVQDDSQTLVGASDPTYDFIGTIGSTTGTSSPEWRYTLNTNYSNDDLSANLSLRYIQDMFNSNVVTGGSPVTNTGVDQTWYLDLNGTYNLTENVILRGGINNLLDQEPRLYTPNVQANTDPSLYDVLGRSAFVGVKLVF